MLTKSEEQNEKMEMTVDPIKTRSFRISESTSDAFKKIAEEVGGNQQHTMEVLIEAYKSQVDKEASAHPDKIEDFENYMSGIRSLFVDTIKLGDNAKVLARQEYAAQLESKDNIIYELQEKIKDVTEQLKEAEKKNQPLENEIENLKKAIESSKDQAGKDKKTIDEYTQKNEALTEELQVARENDANTRRLYENGVQDIARLHTEIDKLKRNEQPLKDNISKISTENRILLNEKENLERQVIELTKDIESLKATHNAELKLVQSQAELSAKNDAYVQIEEIRKELDKTKNEYLSLLEKERKK